MIALFLASVLFMEFAIVKGLQTKGILIIPGRGCGGSSQIRNMSDLPLDQVRFENMSCAIVTPAIYKMYQDQLIHWVITSDWSQCSVSCGNGSMVKTRQCKNATHIFDPSECGGGSETFTKDCFGIPCPVAGGWTNYTVSGSCSVTCGNGTQILVRTCTNPPPSANGANCVGADTDVQSCDTEIPCPETRLLVVGGYIFPSSSLVDIRDLSGQVPNCPVIPNFPYEDFVGSVAILANDDVLVCGGFYSLNMTITKTCYSYTANDSSWNDSTYSLTVERRGAATVQLNSTHYWITGGSNWSGELDSTEMFTVEDGFVVSYWTIPVAMSYHNLLMVNETSVVILGGSSIDSDKAFMFSTISQTWIALPNLPTPTLLTQAGLVVFPNGRKAVVVAGGATTNATQAYFLDSGTWMYGSAFPSGAMSSAASVQYGNTFLIIGGYIEGAAYQTTIYMYNVTGGWTMLPLGLTYGRFQNAALLVPDMYCPEEAV